MTMSARVFTNSVNVSTSGSQIEAYEQQINHLAHAHAQALSIQIQGPVPTKLKVADALSYLDDVKQKFASNPLHFHEFMKIMKECRSESVDVIAIIGRIFQLFQGYPELIKGFGIFLPPSYNLLLQTSSKFFTETLTQQLGDTSEFPDEITDRESQVGEKQTFDKSLHVAAFCQSDGSSEKTDFAVSYINKVKNLFPEDSVTYQTFMKILSSYLTDQEMGMQDSAKETAVYSQVAKLFANHDDLIQEFKKFVPHARFTVVSKVAPLSDPSIAVVGKCGSLKELMFFDKVRKALNYPEVYDNFLRCLMLFNEDIISRLEAVQLVSSFLGKFPELLKEFKDLLGLKESGINIDHVPQKLINMNNEKLDPDLAMDVDYSAARRHGASYRALPKNFEQPKCSGRTALCREVLNDIWVSFPSWSEDSTFVSSCKTQYEEMIYRCEDERFELDMVIEANASTIQILDSVMKKMSKMTQDEKNSFTLDETLGGSSTVLQQKAIRRIFGDKSDETIENLMKYPVVHVPLIVKKLKSKEEEWKEAQKNFNVIWKEQYESFHMKSLDHQGINFKQNDSKCLRSKSLINEIETLYEERREQIEEGSAVGSSGPHMVLECADLSVLEDAISLISLHVKRQAGIHREDRQRMENLIRQFIPDFLGVERSIVIDDDTDQEDSQLDDSMTTGSETKSGETTPLEDPSSPAEDGESDSEDRIFHLNSENCLKVTERKPTFAKENSNQLAPPLEPQTDMPYTLFFVNNNWYLFLRQLHILIKRLSKLHTQSNILDVSAEEVSDTTGTTSAETPSRYNQLLGKVCSVLSSMLENNQFEEDARDLFGIHAYVSYTMDKVVHNIVRQLQQIISDETCRRCTAQYTQYTKELVACSPLSPWDLSVFESQYQKKVEQLLCDENCYKIIWYKKEKLLTVELLDSDLETCDEPCEVERWSDYVDNFCDSDLVSDSVRESNGSSPVFLMRNFRKQQRMWKTRLEIGRYLLEHRFFPRSPQSCSSHDDQDVTKLTDARISRNRERNRTRSGSSLTEGSSSQDAEIEMRSKRRRRNIVSQAGEAKPRGGRNSPSEKGVVRGTKKSNSNTSKKSISNEKDGQVPHTDDLSKEKKNVCSIEEIDSSVISDSMSDENSQEVTKDVCQRPKLRGRSLQQELQDLGPTSSTGKTKNSSSDFVQTSEVPDKSASGSSRLSDTESVNLQDSSNDRRTALRDTLVVSKGLYRESSVDSSEAKEEDAASPDGDYTLSNSEHGGTVYDSDSEAEECLQLATDTMVIREDTQCRFSGSSYKITFIGHLGSFMYRKKSLRRARKAHRRISKGLSQKFRTWHKVWLDRYVTPSMMKFCHDWLLRSDWCNAGIVCIVEDDTDKPPYRPFSRYRIQFYKDSD